MLPEIARAGACIEPVRDAGEKRCRTGLTVLILTVLLKLFIG